MTWDHDKLVKMAADFNQKHPANDGLDALLLLNERREGRTDEPALDYEQTGRDLELALADFKPSPTIDTSEAIMALRTFAAEFNANRLAELKAQPAPKALPTPSPVSPTPQPQPTQAQAIEQDTERDDDEDGPDR